MSQHVHGSEGVSDTLASPQLLQTNSLHCDVLQDLLPSLCLPSPTVSLLHLPTLGGAEATGVALTHPHPPSCSCAQTPALPGIALHPHPPKGGTTWNKPVAVVGCWVSREEVEQLDGAQCPQLWIACSPLESGE